jgi:hypothetical protein
MTDITKCPKCNREYDEEYERVLANKSGRTKHLRVVNAHTFESAFGTEHGWCIKVSCECGNKYGFEDST